MIIKHILAKSLRYKAFYLDARDIALRTELEHKEFYAFRLLQEFFETYERMPSREEMLIKLSDLPEKENEFIKEYKGLVNELYAMPDDVGEDLLMDQLKEAAEKERIKKFLVRAADTFNDAKSSELLQSMQDIVVAGEAVKTRRVQMNVENVKDNIKFIPYRSDEERIPTGWQTLDTLLYGGVGVRELTCVMAPSGRGKTLWMINLMHNFLEHRVNVLYISLEMSVIDIMRRLYRRILTADKDYMANTKVSEIETRVERFFGCYKAMGRVIYHPANTISVEDIQAEIIKLRLREGFDAQVVIVDHLDLMVSRTKSIRQKESHTYWRLIVDDLRDIPLTHGIALVTGTQSNRRSAEKHLVTAMDVGESFGKVQSSDVVLSLNQDDDEKVKKRIRVAVLKNRDFVAGAAPEMYIDLDRMLICDLQTAKNDYGVDIGETDV